MDGIDRRELLGGALVLLGSACLGCGSAAVKAGGAGPAAAKTSPLARRTYPVRLGVAWRRCFTRRLHWLTSMLHRLGRETTVAIWRDAFRAPDHGLMTRLLAAGWGEDRDGAPLPPIETLLAQTFGSTVEGVSLQEARRLVDMDPALSLPIARFPKLRVTKHVTAYDSIHMGLSGSARLTEALIRRLKKEGELIAYDIVRRSREAESRRRPASAREILRQWAETAGSQEPSIFSAGLDTRLRKATEQEVVVHVRACEWARYFREHHPEVGYLVACSTDDADLRAATSHLHMQRTSTLMEGGPLCDFRIYRA